MAKNEIAVRKTDTIFDEIDQLHKAISQRAYDFFRNGSWSDAFNNRLKAENELITEAGSGTDSEGRTGSTWWPGFLAVDTTDLVVEVTPEELLIEGQTSHEKTSDKGKVHTSEIRTGQAFGLIRFPEAIHTQHSKGRLKGRHAAPDHGDREERHNDGKEGGHQSRVGERSPEVAAKKDCAPTFA